MKTGGEERKAERLKPGRQIFHGILYHLVSRCQEESCPVLGILQAVDRHHRQIKSGSLRHEGCATRQREPSPKNTLGKSAMFTTYDSRRGTGTTGRGMALVQVAKNLSWLA